MCEPQPLSAGLNLLVPDSCGGKRGMQRKRHVPARAGARGDGKPGRTKTEEQDARRGGRRGREQESILHDMPARARAPGANASTRVSELPSAWTDRAAIYACRRPSPWAAAHRQQILMAVVGSEEGRRRKSKTQRRGGRSGARTRKEGVPAHALAPGARCI